MPRRPHCSPQSRKLLSAMLERPDEWRHGYELLVATGLKSGTLYPLLMRLADARLLESEWRNPVPPARAPRHVYRLTGKGRAFAHSLLAEAGRGDAGTAMVPR